MKRLLLLISTLFIQGVNAEDKFDVCNYCSASAMKSKAKHHQSLQSIIHIVSKPNRVVRSYQKEIVEGHGDTFFLNVRQVATSPTAMSDILDTLDFIALLKSRMEGGESIDDLPGLPNNHPTSALELIGNPQNMSIIENGVANWLAAQQDSDGFLNMVAAIFSSATDDLVGKVMAINFPDGSQYIFKIVGLSFDSSGNAYYSVDPVQGSGVDGANNPIPESAADLQNMNINIEGAGTGGNPGAWGTLLNNLNIGFSSSGSSSQSGTLKCSVSGNTITCSFVYNN